MTSSLVKRGDAEQAEALLVKSIKANPGNSALVEVLVKLRASKKDWAGAEVAVNDLASFPQGVLAAKMLTGMLAEIRGQYQEAIQIYKDILTKQPNAQGALSALPKLYVLLDRREDFIAYLKGFINENSKNAYAHKVLGQVYMFEKKWDGASKVLQVALSLDPKSISTYRLLANVLVRQGKDVEMIELYAKGLDALPGNTDLMMDLAKYYERTKAFDKAVIVYEKVVKISPSNEQATNNLAFLLINSAEDSSALKRAVILVERLKGSANPFFQDTYGWVLFKSGEVEKAVEVLKKAVLAVPDNAEFRYHLGESYFAIGQINASKTELEKSVALTGQEGVLEDRGRAKELLKQISISTAEG